MALKRHKALPKWTGPFIGAVERLWFMCANGMAVAPVFGKALAPALSDGCGV